MVQKKAKEDRIDCPVGTFFNDLQRIFGKKSQFNKHLNRSKIEFLKGVKSLLDDRIEYLEKKDSKEADAKLTKVKVE